MAAVLRSASGGLRTSSQWPALRRDKPPGQVAGWGRGGYSIGGEAAEPETDHGD